MVLSLSIFKSEVGRTNNFVIVSFLQGVMSKSLNDTKRSSGQKLQHSTGPRHQEKKRPAEDDKGPRRDRHELSPGHWSKKRAREDPDHRDERGSARPVEPIKVKQERKDRERTSSVGNSDKKDSSDDDSDDSTKGGSEKKKKKKDKKKKKKKEKKKEKKEKEKKEKEKEGKKKEVKS